MRDTQQKLLDAAESRFRSNGYHGVSFRELADALEIKSSSVHYYYRRKEDLGLAVVERYATRLFNKLEEKCAAVSGIHDRLAAFCDLYREALVEDDKICLCGMLGAEEGSLPAEVGDAVAAFLRQNIAWVADTLSGSLEPQKARARAEHMVAALQGAMILAKNLDGIALFDRVIADLLADQLGD